MDNDATRAAIQQTIDSLTQRAADKRAEITRGVGELRKILGELSRLTDAVRIINIYIPTQPIALRLEPESFAAEIDRTLHDAVSAPEESDEPPLLVPEVFDMAGKTALECAIIRLKERGGAPVHFTELAREAVSRGYRSPRGHTDEETIARSFWDALRRVKTDPDQPIVFDGDGMFHYEPNKRRVVALNSELADDQTK